jgi:hypothetical protein
VHVVEKESLIASRVYSRRLEKPPITWPALVVTVLVGMGLATAYSIALQGVDGDRFDLSNLINTRFLFSIVPCSLISLALWTLLYFGFVRSRNPALGPTYFNILAPCVFAASLLSPIVLYGVRSVEHQIALHEAREAWATVPELKAELAAIAAKDRAGDAASLAVLNPRLKTTDQHLVISPVTIASPADVRALTARIRGTLEAIAQAETEDAARWRETRAAIDKALRRANPPPLVRDHVLSQLDQDTKVAVARHGAEADLRERTYAETLAALEVFTRAQGLWRSDGDNLMFARQSDVDAIEEHLNAAERLRRRLFDFPPEPLPRQNWSRPPAGV